MAPLDLVIRGAQIATTSQSTVADVGIAAGRVDAFVHLRLPRARGLSARLDRGDAHVKTGRDALARIHFVERKGAAERSQDQADLFGVACRTGVVAQ